MELVQEISFFLKAIFFKKQYFEVIFWIFNNKIKQIQLLEYKSSREYSEVKNLGLRIYLF